MTICLKKRMKELSKKNESIENKIIADIMRLKKGRLRKLKKGGICKWYRNV